MNKKAPLPLYELQRQPWLIRQVVFLACLALITSLRVCIFVGAILGRRRRFEKSATPVHVVLTGRFESDGWALAHIRPLALSDRCQRVTVVTDHAMGEVCNTTYVCAPRRLQQLIGRTPARALWCIFTVLRTRPHVVGGFHLLPNGIVALIAARLVNARAVYFCVGGWCETWGGGARSENRLFGKLGCDREILERALFRIVQRFDLVVTMGPRARDYLQQREIEGPIAVVAGGIDPSRFARAAGNQREFDVVFVGRLVRVKRVDILLRVVARVASVQPRIRVVIVGDGPLRTDLEELAGALGVSQNTSFVGHQTDVAAWLARARVFMITSDTEGLALSLMEASMAGLPAIVSDVGELSGLVVDGKNGWCVPRRDVEAFASKLIELLADPQQLQRYSITARAAALEYSVKSTTQHWDSLLNSCLGSYQDERHCRRRVRRDQPAE